MIGLPLNSKQICLLIHLLLYNLPSCLLGRVGSDELIEEFSWEYAFFR